MDLIAGLQRRLDAKANPKTKAWWEGYLKHAICFRGVKMAHIRTALHAWIREERIESTFFPLAQKALALCLLRQDKAEDKLAGILYFQEVLLPAGVIDWQTDLSQFALLFTEGYIYDWNTCDWFGVHVLGPLVEREGEACARAIAAWSKSDNLWLRRASGVAFVNLAPRGEGVFPGFVDLLLQICAHTVSHPERSAQTGTGWVLRELSLAEPERVARFVENHIDDFSREAIRQAVSKLPDPVKDKLLQAH
jgi:3-methyladenine DNA glycosylase AlkD